MDGQQAGRPRPGALRRQACSDRRTAPTSTSSSRPAASRCCARRTSSPATGPAPRTCSRPRSAEVAATWSRSELGPELTARRAMVRSLGQWWHRHGGPSRTAPDERAAALRAAAPAARGAGAARPRRPSSSTSSPPRSTAPRRRPPGCSPGRATGSAGDGGPGGARRRPRPRSTTSRSPADRWPQRLDDVAHRLDVRRAWRRTEVVASLFVATAAAITVVAVFPSADSDRRPSPPQPDMVEPPPKVAGHQLAPVLRVNDIDYEYFRSEESARGRPLLRVAVRAGAAAAGRRLDEPAGQPRRGRADRRRQPGRPHQGGWLRLRACCSPPAGRTWSR